MSKLENLVGQRHGKLTVKERIENYEGACDSRVQYTCVCDCGVYVSKVSRTLKRGSKNQACSKCYESPNVKKESKTIERNVNGFATRS